MLLRRVAGILRPASYALDAFNPRTLYDPNRYYAALGLVDDGVPRAVATQLDVRKAYWAKVRDLRPDLERCDPEIWDLVQRAWECLSDPQVRYQYDQVKPPQMWMDRHLLRAIPIVAGRDLERALFSVTERVGPSSYVWFYDEGTPLPTERWLHRWMDLVAYLHWRRGTDQWVRVGVTSRDSRIEVREWGTILLIPRNTPPTIRNALRLMRGLGGPSS